MNGFLHKYFITILNYYFFFVIFDMANKDVKVYVI